MYVWLYLHASVVFTNTHIYTYLWKRLFYACIYGRKFYYGPVADWAIINGFLPIYLPGENWATDDIFCFYFFCAIR